MKKKCRSLLLLELLIAFSLITATIFPIFLYLSWSVKKEMKDFIGLELSRAADYYFLDIKNHLITNHKWDSFEKGTKTSQTKVFPLDPVMIQIGRSSSSFRSHYRLYRHINSDGTNENRTCLKLHCDISFFSPSSTAVPSHTFHYVLFVQKGHS